MIKIGCPAALYTTPGQTWFFKLVGDDAVVRSAASDFAKFFGKPKRTLIPMSTSSAASLPRRVWAFLGSLELTSVVLVLMMILVLFGTLEQVHLGTWLAQKKYFSSWLIFYELENGGRLPVFPGGYTVGGLWLINLAVSHVARARWEWRRFGLLLTHGGLFLLVLGQGLTQMWAQESQMAIEEGHSARSSEDYRHVELAIIDARSPTEDVVYAVPAALLKKGRPIRHDPLPFKIVPQTVFSKFRFKKRRRRAGHHGGGGPDDGIGSPSGGLGR
jgi:hypothetical protein